MIDWTTVTTSSVIGGALIGLATVLLILGNGRTAGVGVIIGGAVSDSIQPNKTQFSQILFLVGLIASPLLYQLFKPLPEVSITHSMPLLVVAGLAVGFGARLGSGCTSGHGICGNARLSRRSHIATVTFFSIGIITVYVLRHVLSI